MASLAILEEQYLADGSVVGYEHPYLVAASAMPQGNSIAPEAMLDEAGKAGRGMLELLAEGMGLAAAVMSASGKLYPPRLCIYERDGAAESWQLRHWD